MKTKSMSMFYNLYTASIKCMTTAHDFVEHVVVRKYQDSVAWYLYDKHGKLLLVCIPF